MEEKRHFFNRQITSIDNRPYIYIIPSPKKEEPSGGPVSLKLRQAEEEVQKEGTVRSAPFFGHRIGKFLSQEKAAIEEFLPIDKALESGLETIRKKLHGARTSRISESEISPEELKHRRFIEERNRAQEALFEEIIGYHHEFGSGLNLDDLLSLHDLMKMEANHEEVCSLEESIHELVECDLLKFLRRKAAEQAWQRLEDYLDQFHIEFPIPSSMKDPAEPERNERIKEERKKSAQDDFVNMPAQQLAEMILGNVPIWVYSYPAKNTYLWQLTVLQGVAAGLAAHFLMKYLAVWEENSSEILNKIKERFVDKIGEIRERGESASDLPDVLSVSKELLRISREQIPDQIWNEICSKMEAVS